MQADTRVSRWAWRAGVALVLAVIWAVVVLVGEAQAYDCTDQGAPGWYNGTTADDAGCITQAEYEAAQSPQGLVDAGVWTSFTLNADGTVTGHSALYDVDVVTEADPLSRPVAATPRLEPDAPTVGEVLFPFRPLAWR